MIEEAALERRSDFLASNMQLFFLSGSKRLLYRAKLSDFSATNMQLFFSLWIKEAALERS